MSPEDKYALGPTETEESSKQQLSAFRPYNPTSNLKDPNGKDTPGFIPPNGAGESVRSKVEEQIQEKQTQDPKDTAREYMLLNFNVDIDLL